MHGSIRECPIDEWWGNALTGIGKPHVYERSGTYEVRVTAYADGCAGPTQTATATISVTV